MSRIAPSTWELSGASACLSFVALCLLAMAASFWVADRYQVFGVFARFLPFLRTLTSVSLAHKQNAKLLFALTL